MPDELIVLEDVHRTYRMGDTRVHALDGVTLTVDSGEYLAIMGPSGSGKSTLMNLIGCLDTPSSGSYRLKGREISRMDDDELARIRNLEIGFVFQTFNLLPRANAIENVELPLVYSGISRKERRERAERALEAVGLGDRMHHRPNEMSGGQRQRVAVARALVNEPALLLADEPTGNLDSKTGAEMMQLFGRLHEDGNAIVLVTHELDLATQTGRMVALRDGRVVSDSRHRGRNGGEGKAILGVRFKPPGKGPVCLTALWRWRTIQNCLEFQGRHRNIRGRLDLARIVRWGDEAVGGAGLPDPGVGSG